MCFIFFQFFMYIFYFFAEIVFVVCFFRISIEILCDSSPEIIYTHMHTKIPSILLFSLIIFFLSKYSSFFSVSLFFSVVLCRGGIFLFGSNRYSTYFHIICEQAHGHTLISSHSNPMENTRNILILWKSYTQAQVNNTNKTHTHTVGPRTIENFHDLFSFTVFSLLRLCVCVRSWWWWWYSVDFSYELELLLLLLLLQWRWSPLVCMYRDRNGCCGCIRAYGFGWNRFSCSISFFHSLHLFRSFGVG